MNINIRKGLFETSSSSEDSLSIYQDMKLYVLPKTVYEAFTDGRVCLRFYNTLHPAWSDDENCINEVNSKFINNSIPGKPGEFNNRSILYSLDKVYINYNSWVKTLRWHYYDVELFNYEDNDNMIFGYYGYTQE